MYFIFDKDDNPIKIHKDCNDKDDLKVLEYNYSEIKDYFEHMLDECKIRENNEEENNEEYDDEDDDEEENNEEQDDEDEENNEEEEEDDENDEDEENNELDKFDNDAKLNKSKYHNFMDDLNIGFKKAMRSNNEELMNNIVKLMNTLGTNQANNNKQINNKKQANNSKQINNNKQANSNKQANNKQANNIEQINSIKINNNKSFSDKVAGIKKVINPKHVEDKESFEYSITLFMHREIGRNYNRKKNIQPFLMFNNFKGINYPLKKEDYKTFEKNNKNIALIIQKPDDDNKEVIYHYKSKFIKQRQQVICLLLLNDKCYAYATDPITTSDIEKIN